MDVRAPNRTPTGLKNRVRANPNKVLSDALCIGPGMPMYMSHSAYPTSNYTALNKVHVECSSHRNRTKRTKRTLTGLGRRLVPTQMKCFLKCLVSAMECLCRCLTSQQNSLHYTALIKFVWKARRIEIGQNGQNGQNGHSLESEGDFVFTQMSCFLTHLVSVMECLCICANSQNPFRITLL